MAALVRVRVGGETAEVAHAEEIAAHPDCLAWADRYNDRASPLFSRMAGILSADEAQLLQTFLTRADAHDLQAWCWEFPNF